MKINKAGREIVMRWEGLRLKAYLCPAKVWTIGYGHTKNVTEGQQITTEDAERFLAEDLECFERHVADAAPGANENEFSAMVSFAYNVGPSALRRSALLTRFKKGDKAGAALEFKKWVYGGGKILPGLVKRREAEMALFLKPVS